MPRQRSRPQPKPGRTPQEIQDAKKSKPEDVLAFALYLYLSGKWAAATELWRRYFDAESGRFMGNAASANHRGMAAALAYLLSGTKMARLYWQGRFRDELETGYFGLGESRSNKYQVWSLASIALVWEGAKRTGDLDLQESAARVYCGTLVSWALGGTEKPSQLTAGKWSGVYVSGSGLRSDPGHQEGDARAWVLQTELYPDHDLQDTYRENANKRAAKVKRTDTPGDRKLVSELWWLDAITLARRAGLSLPDDLKAACRSVLGPTGEGVSRLTPVISRALPGTHFPFHFLYYPGGERVTYIEVRDCPERCIYGDRVGADGAVAFAFPYPDGIAKTARGGTCGVEGGRVVARSAHGEGTFGLPAGKPTAHLVWDGSGLREAGAAA